MRALAGLAIVVSVCVAAQWLIVGALWLIVSIL